MDIRSMGNHVHHITYGGFCFTYNDGVAKTLDMRDECETVEFPPQHNKQDLIHPAYACSVKMTNTWFQLAERHRHPHIGRMPLYRGDTRRHNLFTPRQGVRNRAGDWI